MLPPRPLAILFLILVEPLLFKASLYANVVVYEGDVFPEVAGWNPNPFCDPGRWVVAGWFLQHVDSCEGFPRPGGQQESFKRWLADFIGEDQFFIEWRMQTDGDSSEIGGVAPAAFVASGPTSGVSYHFTISRDLVRLIRDNFLPIVFVEIDPGVPHTYRLELYGDELYVWYIDGKVVDSGVPEAAFPEGSLDVISFRAKSWYLENTTAWSYVRYGTTPVDGSGDYDSDDQVDPFDFYFFHECLESNGPDTDAWPGCVFADMDEDGDVDLTDFAAFQNAFTGSD